MGYVMPRTDDQEKRLMLAREIIKVMNSYNLSVDDFSDAEMNHFIDVFTLANRDLAVSIVCEACLKRLAFRY